MRTDTNQYWKLFKPAACSLKLKGSEQGQVFDELVQNLIAASGFEPELQAGVVRTLIERERLASTGVGTGVAIPHVEIPGLKQVVVSLSIHPDGVDWRAIDGGLVHLFFVVLRPLRGVDGHDAERHLEMMRWISRLARHEDFRRFAIAARTRTELVNLLKEMAGA